MPENKIVRSITGLFDTVDATEQTVPLVVDGAVAASSIAVPVGQQMTISDVILGCHQSRSYWQIQTTSDGISWSTIAFFGIQSSNSIRPSEQYSYNVGLVINGGANVAVRVRIMTPFGAALYNQVTLRSYVAA